MEKWRDFVWQLLIGLLVIFFGGWILGIMLNLVAMASPQMVSTIFCPAGSTAIQVSALDQPGQNGSTLSCHDQNGTSVPTLSDAESIRLQRKYFYTPSNIIMIILLGGWFIWRRKRN
jgi:hypothetical protein